MKKLALICLLFSGCIVVDPDEPECTMTYQGRDAKHWYKGLSDRDENIQANCVFALSQLGNEGDYYFVKGMRTNDPYVQGACIGHWSGNRSADNLKPYKDDLLPFLRKTANEKGNNGSAARKILKEWKVQ